MAHFDHAPRNTKVGPPGRIITVHVSERVLEVLTREAKTRSLTSGGLAQRLFDAGYAAMFGNTGDVQLERCVNDALSGRLYRQAKRTQEGIAGPPAVASDEEPSPACPDPIELPRPPIRPVGPSPVPDALPAPHAEVVQSAPQVEPPPPPPRDEDEPSDADIRPARGFMAAGVGPAGMAKQMSWTIDYAKACRAEARKSR